MTREGGPQWVGVLEVEITMEKKGIGYWKTRKHRDKSIKERKSTQQFLGSVAGLNTTLSFLLIKGHLFASQYCTILRLFYIDCNNHAKNPIVNKALRVSCQKRIRPLYSSFFIRLSLIQCCSFYTFFILLCCHLPERILCQVIRSCWSSRKKKKKS